jgi:hypothetical protein
MAKADITQQPSIVRTKKIGPLHVVYVGRKHIGTVVNPITGGSKKNLNKYIAIHRELQKQKSHRSKKDAVDWLSTTGGYTPRIREQEEKPSDILYGPTTNMNRKISIRKQQNAQIVRKNPEVQYQQIVYDNHKETFMNIYNKAKLG